MKSFFLVLAALLPIQAFALTEVPVTVQCNIEGPIFKGTLKTELDISKWEVKTACQGLTQTLKVPEFVLKFNDLTYTPYQTSIEVGYSDYATCSVPIEMSALTFVESTTKFQTRGLLNLEKSNFIHSIGLVTSLSRCSVQIVK